jgi:hypothetical protein
LLGKGADEPLHVKHGRRVHIGGRMVAGELPNPLYLRRPIRFSRIATSSLPRIQPLD